LRNDQIPSLTIATEFATGKRQEYDAMFEVGLSHSRKFCKGKTIIQAVSSHRAGAQP
jgi:hypothetical protein